MVEIATDTLAEVCGGNVWVVGSYSGTTAQVIPDRKPAGAESASGPLVGIYTAMSHGTAEWTAVLACDLPFASSDLFFHLAALVSSDVDAVVPVQADTRFQPLAAIYRTTAIKTMAENALVRGMLSLKLVLGEARTRSVELAEMGALPNTDRILHNVNTPEDLGSARRWIATAPSSI